MPKIVVPEENIAGLPSFYAYLHLVIHATAIRKTFPFSIICPSVIIKACEKYLFVIQTAHGKDRNREVLL